MKKVLITILMAMILLLSVSIASASMTGTTVVLGGTSTSAANENYDNDDGQDAPVAGTFTLTSSGNGEITALVCTIATASGYKNILSSDTDDYDDDLNMVVTPQAVTIANASNVIVDVTARIPAKLDAVDSDGDPTAYTTATITCTGTENSASIQTSVSVTMQRENLLEIKKVYLTSEENSHELVTDGETIRELRTNDDILIEIRADNKYSRIDEVDIEDIDAYVYIDDGDMDIDDYESLSDLDAGDDTDTDDAAEIEFNIDDDVSDDTYHGYIYVVGDDEFGARHGEKWDIDFKVERESHEIIIKTATISQDSVSCSRGGNSVYVKLLNRGKNDEDEVALYVTNSALSLDYEQEDMTIDETDDMTKTVVFTVSDSLAAGTYPIRVKVYYSGDENDGVLGDLKDLDLVVQACVSVTPTTTTTDTTVDVITLTDDDVATLTSDTTADATVEEDDVTETVEKPFTESWLYATVLIAGVVVAAGWLVFLVLKLLVFV